MRHGLQNTYNTFAFGTVWATKFDNYQNTIQSHHPPTKYANETANKHTESEVQQPTSAQSQNQEVNQMTKLNEI